MKKDTTDSDQAIGTSTKNKLLVGFYRFAYALLSRLEAWGDECKRHPFIMIGRMMVWSVTSLILIHVVHVAGWSYITLDAFMITLLVLIIPVRWLDEWIFILDLCGFCIITPTRTISDIEKSDS